MFPAPGGLAAWSLGIPVVLHEQNGIAGLTNQWLAKIATTVMQAFPGAFPNAEVVGNPVRTDVLALPLPQERLAGRDGPIRVLVVGGSQGARVLKPDAAAGCRQTGRYGYNLASKRKRRAAHGRAGICRGGTTAA